MKPFVLFLAALSGCATIENGTFQKMRAEIEAQRAKITRMQQEKALEAHRLQVIEGQRDEMLAHNRAVHRQEQPEAYRPPAAVSDPGEEADRRRLEARDQSMGDSTPAPRQDAAPPATAPPAPVQVAPAVFSPFPDQRTAYLARTPTGWGASPLSFMVINEVERWLPDYSGREKFCWLGIEVDHEQSIVVQPSSLAGALPRLYQVKEGSTVRSVTLVPPGESAYIMLNEPGKHHFRMRCYVGPPRMTTINNNGQQVVVLVLQLFSEWQDYLTNPTRFVADEWHLKEVPFGRLE